MATEDDDNPALKLLRQIRSQVEASVAPAVLKAGIEFLEKS